MPSSAQVVPPSVDPATPSARDPFAASAATVCATFCATSAAGFARSTIACGAPLATTTDLPAPSVTVASVRFVTGSNGTNFDCFQACRAPWSFSAVMTAVSIASRSSMREASAAARMQSCGSVAASITGSPSLSWFLVSVPVLSEQRMSTPAISSIAESFETIAFSLERASAPSAMVIENTVGIATGMEATSNTSTNCSMPSASLRPHVSTITMSW